MNEVPALKQRLLEAVPPPVRVILVVIWVTGLYWFVATSRVSQSENSIPSLTIDPPGLYWTEQALQYRYARMVADGTGIPEFDPLLQTPGVRPLESMTILLEYLIGYSYRVFGTGVPFWVYVTRFTSCFVTLSIVPVYLLARWVANNRLAGVFASLLYAFSPASVGRSVLSCGREDIALPLLFGWTALAVGVLCGRSRSWLVAIVPLVVLSLAGWHFSRFYFLIVSAVLGLLYILRGAAFELRADPENADGTGDADGMRNLSEQPAHAAPILHVSTTLSLSALLAAVSVPVLRASHFYLSPAFLFSTALSCLLWIEHLRARQQSAGSSIRSMVGRTVSLTVCSGIWLVPAALFRSEEAGYAHVWQLFVEKARFLGIKPSDPLQIAPEARLLWREAFNSPTLHYVLGAFWGILAAAVCTICCVVVVRMCRRADAGRRRSVDRTNQVAWHFVLALTLIFAALFVMITRIAVFVAFFGTVAVAIAALRLRGTPAVVNGILLGIIGCLSVANAPGKSNAAIPELVNRVTGFKDEKEDYVYKYSFDDESLVHWIREHTTSDSVFAGRIGISPLILTYADRGIALQPKFEIPESRDRATRFFQALFDSESSLVRELDAWGVNYVVLDGRTMLDKTGDSARYANGLMDVSTTSPAWSMQFAPERLKEFQLVFEARCYRVFHRHQGKKLHDDFIPSHHSFYDISRFGGQTGEEDIFDDQYTVGVIHDCRRADELRDEAMSAGMAGRTARAVDLLNQAMLLNPAVRGAHLWLGMLAMQKRAPAVAIEHLKRETQLVPYCPMAALQFGRVLDATGTPEKALVQYERALRIDPEIPNIRSLIQQTTSRVSGMPPR